MKSSYKAFSWVFLHFLTIVLVLTSLLTGLRIAAVSRPEILHFSALLPQGYLHSVHLSSGFDLLAIGLVYLGYRLRSTRPKLGKSHAFAIHYHRKIIHFGELTLFITLLCGSLLYFSPFTSSLLVDFHFVAALLLLHGGGYFVQQGFRALKRISVATFVLHRDSLVIAVVISLFGILFWFTDNFSHHQLKIKNITLNNFIDIDGVACAELVEVSK